MIWLVVSFVKLKAALLGCGRWGQTTSEVLSTLKEQGLIGSIAVVDTSRRGTTHVQNLADFTSPTMEGIDADFVS